MLKKNANNNFMKNMIMVLFSNGIILISNVLTALLLPKLMGTTNYGYYKIFTLYLSYTALLHLGFVDGILLKHAGMRYEDIDKHKFVFNTKFFLKMQVSISLFLVIIALVLCQNEYRIIMVLLGIDTFLINMSTYYQFLSQCTMRFKELATRNILLSVFKILITIIMMVCYKFGLINLVRYYIYIICIILVDVVLVLKYIYTYRDITFGYNEKNSNYKKEIFAYFKCGIVLTIAYQIANLVFTLDRQFVALLFDTNIYGVYSFSYTLIALVTTAVSSISIVLFPTLKQKKQEVVIKQFSDSIAIVMMLTYLAHVIYYPFTIFVQWYLPDYVGSLEIIKIILPGLAITSCITSIFFTYYKVLDKIKIYLMISVGVLLLSICANIIVYNQFGTTESISCVSILVLIIWYLLAEIYFIKKYNVKWKKNFLYLVSMMWAFYGIEYLKFDSIIAFLVYISCYTVVTLCCYSKLLHKTILGLKK